MSKQAVFRSQYYERVLRGSSMSEVSIGERQTREV
jgi:hypothetical protein